MQRRDFIALLVGTAAWPLTVRAQPKSALVGYMGNSTATLEANLVGSFRDGLRELGYEEGRNITVKYLWA
ncbi:MAG: ABC transporter substrate-binding protein, partial [Pseudolabrys sp.]